MLTFLQEKFWNLTGRHNHFHVSSAYPDYNPEYILDVFYLYVISDVMMLDSFSPVLPVFSWQVPGSSPWDSGCGLTPRQRDCSKPQTRLRSSSPVRNAPVPEWLLQVCMLEGIDGSWGDESQRWTGVELPCEPRGQYRSYFMLFAGATTRWQLVNRL